MAKFNIVRTQRTLSGRGPGVRAAMDVRTGGVQTAQAISGLGAAIQQEAVKYDLLEAATQLDTAKRLSREEINRLSLSFEGNLDPATYHKEYEKSVKTIQGFTPKNPMGARAFGSWVNDRTPIWAEGVEDSRRARVEDNFRAGIFELKAEAEKTGDLSKLKQQLAIGKRLGILSAEETAKETASAEEAAAAGAIENIKPLLIAAIEKTGDKEDGYKALDVATKQLAKDGILTEPEAAEANKTLGDWMDNYVAGRIKAAKDNRVAQTRQTYQDFSKSILEGKLTYDEVERSVLLKADKGKWLGDDDNKGYIKGSYKDAPRENTPEGHRVSFNAVYNVATLQLSPKEGYDALLNARFNDRSITDEQFRWALDKIENPYPQHILEDLGAVLKSNLENYNRLFKFDNNRNKKVNESLIGWVDELIKQDKVSLLDFKKQMEAMSSAYRAGGGQPYDVGRIIEVGGVEWEIVGFDESGEPLVEASP